MKKNYQEIFQKGLALLLCLSMVLSYVPLPAFAEGVDPHHPVHTPECGYSQAEPGSPCTHVHTQECETLCTACVHVHDASCYSDVSLMEQGAAPDACTHTCTQADGCVTWVLSCTHVHDASCGYGQGNPGSPCTFVCTGEHEDASRQTAPEQNPPEDATEPIEATNPAEEPTEEPAEEPTEEPTEPEQQISAWSWVDTQGAIELDTGLVLIPGDPENLAPLEALLSLLPGAILAQVEDNWQTIPLAAWHCDGYPQAGAYQGTYLFTAELPRGYALAENAAPLTLTVAMDTPTLLVENAVAKIGNVEYSSLQEALYAAREEFNATITLLSDAGLTADTTLQSGYESTTLDLAGHTIDCGVFSLDVNTSDPYTLRDSVGGGKIISNGQPLTLRSGCLTIEGGWICPGITTDGGSLFITGGTFGSEESTAHGLVAKNTIIQLSGGTFHGLTLPTVYFSRYLAKGYNFYLGETPINPGVDISSNSVDQTLTVRYHTHTPGEDGVCPCGWKAVAKVAAGQAVTYYEDLQAAADFAGGAEGAAVITLLQKYNHSFAVTSGTVTLNLNGNYVDIDKTDPLLVVGEGARLVLEGDGKIVNTSGPAIRNSGTLVIRGGLYSPQVIQTAVGSMQISGGTFEVGIADTSALSNEGGSLSALLAEDITLTYGTELVNVYTENVTRKNGRVYAVPHQHQLSAENGYSCACGYVPAALVTAGEQTSYFHSLGDALSHAAAHSGATLQLLRDITLPQGESLTIDSGTLTIWWNGHTLNADAPGCALAVTGSAQVTLSGDGGIRNTGPALVFSASGSLTITGGTYSPQVVKAADTSGTVRISGGQFQNPQDAGCSGALVNRAGSLLDLLTTGYGFFYQDGQLIRFCGVADTDAGKTVVVGAHQHTLQSNGYCICPCGLQCYQKGLDENGYCSTCNYTFVAETKTWYDYISRTTSYFLQGKFNEAITLALTKPLPNSQDSSSVKLLSDAVYSGTEAWRQNIDMNLNGHSVTLDTDIAVRGRVLSLSGGQNSVIKGTGALIVSNGGSVIISSAFGGTLESDVVIERSILSVRPDSAVHIRSLTVGENSGITLSGGTYGEIMPKGNLSIPLGSMLPTGYVFQTIGSAEPPIKYCSTDSLGSGIRNVAAVRCDHKNADGSTSFDESSSCTYCGIHCDHTAGPDAEQNCAQCKLPLVASVAVDGNPLYYAAVETALNYAAALTGTGQVTVTLLHEARLTQALSLGGAAPIALDLNGNTLYKSGDGEINLAASSGAFTLTDSRAGGSCEVPIVCAAGRSLIVDSGDWGAVSVKENLTVTGGCIRRLEVAGGANVRLSGGTFGNISSGCVLAELLAEGYAFADASGAIFHAVETYNSNKPFTVVPHTHDFLGATPGECACGVRASVSVTQGSTTAYYCVLNDALDAARREENTGCTVRLLEDCPLDGLYELDTGRFTLDLNHMQLKAGAQWDDGGSPATAALRITRDGSITIVGDGTVNAYLFIHSLERGNGTTLLGGLYSYIDVDGDFFSIQFWDLAKANHFCLKRTDGSWVDMMGSVALVYRNVIATATPAYLTAEPQDAVVPLNVTQLPDQLAKLTAFVADGWSLTATWYLRNPGTGSKDQVASGQLASGVPMGAVAFDNQNLAVGITNATCKLVATKQGEQDFVFNVDLRLEVTKIPPVVTVIPRENLAYNGQPQNLLANGTTTGGTLQYCLEENGAYSVDIPTATGAGTYSLWYKVVGDERYQEIPPTMLEVTVARAENQWTAEPAITGWTYGETANTPTGEARIGTVKVDYRRADGSTYNTTVPTAAGDYMARFTVEGTEDYGPLAKEVKFTIARRELTVTITPNGGTYAGTITPASAKLNGVQNGDTVPMELTYNGSTAVPTAAGTYTVKVTITSNDYTLTGKTTASFAIAKAEVETPTLNSKVYTGAVQTADVPTSSLYTVSKNQGGISVGTYGVELALTDPANYQWDNENGRTSFAITKSGNQWTAEPTIIGWTYGDTAGTPTGEAKFGAVKVTYSSDGQTFAPTVPTAAGNYTARFAVADTPDYDGLTVNKTFTIAKRELTVTITPNGGIYAGIITPAAAQLNGVLDGDTVPMELTYDGSTTVPTTAGTYAIAVTIDSKDYVLTGETTASFVIAKAEVETPTLGSKVYTGAVQTADVPTSSLYTVSKNQGGTSVGTYGVELTLTDPANYRWDAKNGMTDFAITKSENTWTAEPTITGWTYGDTAGTPSGKAKFGEMKVTYSADGQTFTSAVPTAAGDYMARFTVEGTQDYGPLAKEVKFTIARRELTVTITPNGGTYAGTITPASAKLNGVQNGDTVPMELTYNGSTAVPTAAGTYTVKVTITSNDYTLTGKTTASFAIAKAEVETPTLNSKVYTGAVQTADVPTSSLYTVSKNQGGISVGTYGVELALTDPANYQWDNENGRTSFAITKSGNQWTAEPTITGWTYGDTAGTPIGEAKFGVVKVTYSADGQTFTSTVPTAAGNYTARFAVADTPDYDGLTVNKTFTIAKRELTVTITPNGGTYAGTITPAAAQLNGLANGDTVEPDLTYNGSAAVPTTAGTYTVKVTITSNDYTLTGETTANFVIAKAEVETPTLNSKVYTGAAQTADVPTSPLYTVTKNDGGTSVGTYGVELTLTDPANYQWDNENGRTSFAITKSGNQWTAEPAITGWTYGDTAGTPIGEAKFGVVKVTYSSDGQTFAYAVPTAAGNYTARFTVAETPDYDGLTVDKTFTITRRKVNIIGAAVESAKVYDGTTQAVLTNGGTLSDNLDGGNLTIRVGTATYEDRNVGTGKTVSFRDFSLTGSAADNYLLAGQPDSVTADITARDVALTVTVRDKTFDGSTNAQIETAVLSGVVDGDDVTAENGQASFAHRGVGRWAISFRDFALTGGDAGNYHLTNPQPEGITAAILAVGNYLDLSHVPEFDGQTQVSVDGEWYPIQEDGGRYVHLPETGELLTLYSYASGDAIGAHTNYPTGMQVYRIHRNADGATVTEIPELADLLQYRGCSIRVTGKQGIRIVTAITDSNKAALTGSGLAGFTLEEYGTVVCWAGSLPAGESLTLGKPCARSNYAYRKGVSDPVFDRVNGTMQYTNVLVGFSLEECSRDLIMRPYITLRDGEGNPVTLYGGSVQRSIGYIAYQNRSAFPGGTPAYEYVWNIIHAVYGTAYDDAYTG